MIVANILTILLASAGLIFMAVSFFGIVKFPDFFTRLHAQGVGDTLGALLIILAMMIAAGLHLISIKVFLLFLFIMLTNPLGTNMIMIAAIHNRDYQGYNKEEESVKTNKSESNKKESAKK